MQTIINNGDTGLAARTAINNMFTELYGNIPVPKKLINVSGNSTFQVEANIMVASIEAATITGNPILRIGITANGTEIMEDVAVGSFANVKVDMYFPAVHLLYFSVTGSGSINIRIDQINNYF